MHGLRHRLTRLSAAYASSTRPVLTYSSSAHFSRPSRHSSTFSSNHSLCSATTRRQARARSPVVPRSTSRSTTQTQHRCHGTFIKERPADPAPKAADLRKTALHDLHVARGGKMVPFGGFSMPVQYSDLGVRESHLWTRERASLFDVGHMVQHHFHGPDAAILLRQVTPSAVGSIAPFSSTLSALLLPKTGGIVDDCIITRLGPKSFYVVTNAACRENDIKFLREHINAMYGANATSEEDHSGGRLVWKVLEDAGLVALQGPQAKDVLEPLLVDRDSRKLSELHFGKCMYGRVEMKDGSASGGMLISRGGYTGEDGFEISVPGGPEETVAFVERLLGDERVRLAGLGARDSLRLEAGMCLYGHDIDDETTPVEAGLSWIIAKERRFQGGFNGADVILQQLKPKKDGGGVSKRRVGFIVEGPPAREGHMVISENGSHIGQVTSGCPSPSLGKNIAMGYMPDGHHQAGKKWAAQIRGRAHSATITKMPFLPSKYWKGGASPG